MSNLMEEACKCANAELVSGVGEILAPSKKDDVMNMLVKAVLMMIDTDETTEEITKDGHIITYSDSVQDTLDSIMVGSDVRCSVRSGNEMYAVAESFTEKGEITHVTVSHTKDGVVHIESAKYTSNEYSCATCILYDAIDRYLCDKYKGTNINICDMSTVMGEALSLNANFIGYTEVDDDYLIIINESKKQEEE